MNDINFNPRQESRDNGSHASRRAKWTVSEQTSNFYMEDIGYFDDDEPTGPGGILRCSTVAAAVADRVAVVLRARGAETGGNAGLLRCGGWEGRAKLLYDQRITARQIRARLARPQC